MKKATKFGLVLAVAGSLAYGTPAFAASFTGDNVFVGPDAGRWGWNNWSRLSVGGASNLTWRELGGSAAWDQTSVVVYGSTSRTPTRYDCANPADLSTATDGSGDQILTCDPQQIDNGDGPVTVEVEYRFYADGQTWRQHVTLFNGGLSPIEGQILRFYFAAYQGYDGTAVSFANTVGRTSDWTTDYDTLPTYVTTPSDVTWVTDDRTDYVSAPVVKYSVGRSDALLLPANNTERDLVSGGQGFDGDEGHEGAYIYFELPSMAAGQSVEIVTLSKVFLFDDAITAVPPMTTPWQTATYGAVQAAIADTALESDAVVFAGISDRSRVLNWTPAISPIPTPTAVPQALPATGVDSESLAGFGGLAALVVAAGAGVLVTLRRRTSAR